MWVGWYWAHTRASPTRGQFAITTRQVFSQKPTCAIRLISDGAGGGGAYVWFVAHVLLSNFGSFYGLWKVRVPLTVAQN